MHTNQNGHNVYDVTYRPYGAQKEGRSEGGCFSPALSGEQDDCGRWKKRETREGEKKEDEIRVTVSESGGDLREVQRARKSNKNR